MKSFIWFTYGIILWSLNESHSQEPPHFIQKDFHIDSSVQKINDSILSENIRINKMDEERMVKSEKITLGVVSIVGGLALSVVGVFDKSFPVENCDDSNGGLSGCPIDENATDKKNTRGNILLATGIGLVGFGVFTLLWAQ